MNHGGPNHNELNFFHSNDLNFLKEIINIEKKKSMNYRYQLTEITKQIQLLEENVIEKNMIIDKLAKEREHDAKYLLKLEGVIYQLQTQLNNFNNQSTNLQKQKLVENENINQTILSLTEENKNLIDFRNSIYNLSRLQNEINLNVINNIKEVNNFFNSVNFDDIEINFNKENLEKVSEYMNTTILQIDNIVKLKHEEYLYLLDTKEKENVMLSEEIFNMKNKIQEIMNDRLKDQQIINRLENEVRFLNTKYENYKKSGVEEISYTHNNLKNKNIVIIYFIT